MIQGIMLVTPQHKENIMPLQKCTKDGKSGWKYGDSGTCYTGNGAREKARKQGVAIKISQQKHGKSNLIGQIEKYLSGRNIGVDRK